MGGLPLLTSFRFGGGGGGGGGRARKGVEEVPLLLKVLVEE